MTLYDLTPAAVWLFFAVLIGLLARSRGRSGVGWGILAALFTPILMGLLVAVLPRKQAVPLDDLGQPITPVTHVLCPDCKAPVLKAARKCRHCGTALVPQE